MSKKNKRKSHLYSSQPLKERKKNYFKKDVSNLLKKKENTNALVVQIIVHVIVLIVLQKHIITHLHFFLKHLEQLFSLFKKYKTPQRYCLNDETLRNCLFIKFNSRCIELDFNRLQNAPKYKSIFNQVQKTFASLDAYHDQLLETDVEEWELEYEEEEEPVILGSNIVLNE